MLDFLSIEKPLFKDKPNFASLESIGFSYGKHIYQMPNLPQVKIYHSEQAKYLNIKGSLPYLVNGQNFSFNDYEFKLAIDALQDALEVSLLNAWVNSFEYGKIIECGQDIGLTIKNHHRLKGAKLRAYSDGRYFENGLYKMKVYNAKTRIVQQLGKVERDILKRLGEYDPNKNYLKIEMHYKKPERMFQRAEGVYLIDLMSKDFINLCKENLVEMYQQIEKGGEVQIPENKKHLSSLNLVYIALKEAGLQYGFEPKEKLQEVLKSIPEEVLNVNDKKQRRRQIRQAEELLKSGELSRFDMSEPLKKGLWI